MFPDARLLIAALLTSIFTLCCGFGIFAAFRVNHEPLSRLPADTVALQLATHETAGPPPIWGMPVGPGLAASASTGHVEIDGAPADTQTPPPHGAMVQPASLRAVEAPRSTPATEASEPPHPPQHVVPPVVAALPVPAEDASAPASAAPEPPPAPSTPAIASPALAATPSPAPGAPAEQTPAAQTKPAQPSPDANEDTAHKAGDPATAAPPTVAAIEPPAIATSAPAPVIVAAAAAPDAMVPEPKARPAPVNNAAHHASRKIALKAIERRRAAARRRILPKPPAGDVTQFGYQNSTSQNPVFQTAPNAFQRQAATSHNASTKTTTFGWPNTQPSTQ